MSCSSCRALPGGNPNQKKRKEKRKAIHSKIFYSKSYLRWKSSLSKCASKQNLLKTKKWKNQAPFLRYYSMEWSTSKIATQRWWVSVLQLQYIFENIFSTVNLLAMKRENVLQNLEEWVLNPGSFYLTTINQKPVMMSLWFFNFLKVCIKTIKNSKHDLKNYQMLF